MEDEGILVQVTFEVGYFKKGNGSCVVLLIGGLMHNLFNHNCFREIQRTLCNKYTVCTVQLRSTGCGFGIYTIDDDVEDITAIIEDLKKKQKVERIVLIGHSTGCQDVVACLRQSLDKKYPVVKCVLQCPVSDRDFGRTFHGINEEVGRLMKKYNAKSEKELSSLPNVNSLTDASNEKYAENIMLMERRFISLFAQGGYEDFFSTDITNEEFSNIFQCIQIPVLLVFATQDQYVPYSSEEYALLMKRICASNTNFTMKTVADNHSMEGDGLQVFVELVKEFL
ncbi:hypothetical protein EIN_380770 [Entamoeba invadens IP1]|uniref:AB hydrolase-1 domain-containing protein n=1 Tax=Entamoeba invadens IP1 TaxID=370355 RepID=A0A0A1UAW2_ENTIV|nr:hypothetical protein EIN_380770 [Entamoeba invadens IP1]ELP92130.1 hypothetical protein EIN_380770 [Entamoeba invadens IP1]|eukprot:XP_004258901.1 hypothetical protein EIN_380770 [Entamoeba invadens IP1]